MSAQPISPAEINRRNSEFWGKETPEAMRLLQMDGLLEGAMAELEEDAERFLSLAQHRGLEKAVRDFNRRLPLYQPLIARGIRSEQARVAGSAKKTDRLQELIVELVRENPRLTAPQLRVRLEGLKRQKGPLDYVVVEDFDDENICFVRKDGKGDSAPISRLKDRLSRAKKKLVAQTR